jgi:hypothetical protein
MIFGTSNPPGIPFEFRAFGSAIGFLSLSRLSHAKEAQSKESVLPVPVGLSSKAFSPLFKARITLVM